MLAGSVALLPVNNVARKARASGLGACDIEVPLVAVDLRWKADVELKRRAYSTSTSFVFRHFCFAILLRVRPKKGFLTGAGSIQACFVNLLHTRLQ